MSSLSVVLSVAPCVYPDSLRHRSLHRLYRLFLERHPGDKRLPTGIHFFGKIGKSVFQCFYEFAMDSYELRIFTK